MSLEVRFSGPRLLRVAFEIIDIVQEFWIM